MTRSVSGRAAADQQRERGETGGCGVDRSRWGGGEVNRRAKARLKGTRKAFFFLSDTRQSWSKVSAIVNAQKVTVQNFCVE